ncbi:MAG: capsular biosynthesis protein [Sphingopyxis sp.]|nr:capsular biosynthesis protein [Sphingopyxis sp.]
MRAMRFLTALMLALCAVPLLNVAASAQAPATMPVVPTAPVAQAAPASPTSLADGYLLGPGDVVEVAIIGRSDFSGRMQIQVDGTVQLPLIGDIPAANRTVLQLRSDIRNALIAGQYFTEPAVSVTVVSYASRYVTVLGEVATPGIVAIDRAYRVSEIMARVGGLRATAADVITLARSTGEALKLDMVAVATGDIAQDVIVNPGDRIFVAQAPQFYIYGEVNGPGSYKLERNMSLRMALARGGGVTVQGSERRVKVIRDGKEIKKFDLNAPLQPNDTVQVGQRIF